MNKLLLVISFAISGCSQTPAWAGVNVDKLADAIYWAEGGAKTSHPYGILAHYKHTTPRQACKNSILSGIKRAKSDDYRVIISEIGRVYCPIGASNDKQGLNLHWVGNVTRLYEKSL